MAHCVPRMSGGDASGVRGPLTEGARNLLGTFQAEAFSTADVTSLHCLCVAAPPTPPHANTPPPPLPLLLRLPLQSISPPLPLHTLLRHQQLLQQVSERGREDVSLSGLYAAQDNIMRWCGLLCVGGFEFLCGTNLFERRSVQCPHSFGGWGCTAVWGQRQTAPLGPLPPCVFSPVSRYCRALEAHAS